MGERKIGALKIRFELGYRDRYEVKGKSLVPVEVAANEWKSNAIAE